MGFYARRRIDAEVRGLASGLGQVGIGSGRGQGAAVLIQVQNRQEGREVHIRLQQPALLEGANQRQRGQGECCPRRDAAATAGGGILPQAALADVAVDGVALQPVPLGGSRYPKRYPRR